MGLMSSRFVGRASELASVIAGLERSRVVVLGGATGVGKSRLMSEVIAARTAGKREVVTATASTATRAIPLSPFIPLLDREAPTDPGLLLAGILRSIRDREEQVGELLLAVDDAQHLDDASVALLATIVDSTSARLVLTIRTETPPPAALTDLLETCRAEHTEVGPLTRAESDELVGEILGEVAPRLRGQLWRSTRGNPLMLKEMVAGIGRRLARDAAGRVTISGALPTERLVDLARSRLLALDPEVGHAVELLSLAGSLPERVLLRLVSGAALDELVTTGLATRFPSDGVLSVATAHPLYSDILRASLGDFRARELYTELLESVDGSTASLDPLRLASWQLQAGTVRDAGLAITGVRAAIARGDQALAERLLHQVAGMVPVAVETLFRATLMIRAGETDRAERLLAGADPTGLDDAMFVEFALTRAFNLAFDLGRISDADGVLRAAQRQDRPPVVAQRIAIERATITGVHGDFAEAVTGARALLADPDTDASSRTTAYLILVLTQSMQGQCDQLSELAEAGLQAADVTHDEMPFVREHLELVVAATALLSGGLVPMIDHAKELRDDPDRGSVRWLWQAAMSIGYCATGELDAAAEVTEYAHAVPLIGMFDAAGLLQGVIGMVRGHLGDGEGLEELEELRGQRDDLQNATWLDRGRAWLYAARGDLEAARRVLLESAESAAAGAHQLYATVLLHDALRLGPDRADPEISDRLSAAVTHTSGAPLGDLMNGHGQALAASDPDELLKVAGGFAGFGARLLAAEAAAQAASLHQVAGDQLLAARASLLSAAWMHGRRAALTPALLRRPEPPVSERILTVLLAAAAGASSREIAERLFLSPRTVDNHLRTAYRALGLAGRGELAELLAAIR